MLVSLLILLLPFLAKSDYLINHDGQVAFGGDGDEHRHPDWPHRQAALGWHDPTINSLLQEGGDAVYPEIGGGMNGCGGVCVLTPESIEVNDNLLLQLRKFLSIDKLIIGTVLS